MKKSIYKLFLKSLMSISYKIPVFRGRVGHSLYPYMFNPAQLLRISLYAKEAYDRNPSGIFIEAGCAYGATTVFLKKLIPASKYCSIDTFSGFTPESLRHESTKRNKNYNELKHGFTVNKKEWYERNLDFHNINDVHVIESDVTKIDFSILGPISFCLFDVDLYLPISICLPRIYENLLPGGVIVIDDCMPNTIYDGAEQAYKEFCSKVSLPYTVEDGKLGIIRK